jgi:spermidine synthase
MLYVITFVSNAAILVLEIAGARLLAPYLGTSVEVWSGTIGVVLGSMALGYWLGGRAADKHPSRKVLAALLLASGFTALLAWGMRDWAPGFLVEQSSTLALSAILAAAALFAPTTILLAAVSPFIAKLLLTELLSSAKTIGNINAAGTLGSIVGAILTGLVLIPAFGLDQIFLGLAITLIVLSFLASGEIEGKKIVLCVAALLIALGLTNLTPGKESLVADISTPYNRIWVREFPFEGGALRTVSTDPFGTQCGMRVSPDGALDARVIPFFYSQAFDVAARENLLSEKPVRALFLGGCNYSYPRTFLLAFPKAEAVVIEIDPGMTQMATEYFGFKPEEWPSLQIVHEDARRYMAKSDERFDIVFMDTFGSSANIPHHLTTREFFSDLRERLKPGGMLVVNIAGVLQGPSSSFTASMLQTTSVVFDYAAIYKLTGFKEEDLQSLVLIARDSQPLPTRLTNQARPGMILTQVESDTLHSGMVLSDNYAPVERMLLDARTRVFNAWK